MAGRPRVRAAALELEQRAREMRAAGVDGATELDYVCDWVAGGGTLTSLVKELNATASAEVQRSQVMTALWQRFGRDEVSRRLAGARPDGAHAMVEEALAIVDSLEEREGLVTKEDVARAKARADVRHWTATRWNPSELGDQKPAVTVTVNANLLHLDALRASAVKTANAYEQPYQLKPADQFDAGPGSTRALGSAIPLTSGRLYGA